MTKQTEQVNAMRRYIAFIDEQRQVARDVLNALRQFESIADLPLFTAIEEEINQIRKKIIPAIEHPENFCREFEAEEWEE